MHRNHPQRSIIPHVQRPATRKALIERVLLEALERRQMLSSSAMALLDADRADEDRLAVGILMPVETRPASGFRSLQQHQPIGPALPPAPEPQAPAVMPNPASPPGAGPGVAPKAGHGGSQQPGANSAAPGGFTVYSALRSLDAHLGASAGLVPIHVSYGELYDVNPDGSLKMDHASEARVRAIANRVADAGQKWVLDIEHWPVDIRKHSEAEVMESMNKMLQIIAWAKDERPEVEIGFYGVLPLRDYWTPVQLAHYAGKAQANPGHAFEQQMLLQQQQKMADWHGANAFLRPLADAVDFIAPSLYTFYDNPAGWQLYARSNLAEAGRYGKPVIPFIWSQYHDSNSAIGGQFIDGAFWQMQLQTIQAHANGVVIWGDFALQVDPVNHEWWQATAGFIGSLSDGQGGGQGLFTRYEPASVSSEPVLRQAEPADEAASRA